MIEAIVIILISLNIVANLILLKSLIKISIDEKTDSNKLKISVVIAFKNEEKNLPFLLKSILLIDYPINDYEIIFINDNSNDESEKIILQSGLKNLRVISAKEKKLQGKKGALEIGIKNANYEIIAITDADCQPQSNWLNSISDKFSEGYDLVFGYSPLLEGNTFISKISSYENLRNFLLYFASVKLGFPFGATARSLAFKKKVYEYVNGYNNTTETLSGDDDLFIRECVKQNFKIGYFLTPDSFVFSKSSKSFSDYFNRKKRHLKTSHYYLLRHKLILGYWYLINLLPILFIFMIPLSTSFIIPFLIKILLDVFILVKIKNIFKHNFTALQIIFYEIFYQLLLPINFINSIFSRDKWN